MKYTKEYNILFFYFLENIIMIITAFQRILNQILLLEKSIKLLKLIWGKKERANELSFLIW